MDLIDTHAHLDVFPRKGVRPEDLSEILRRSYIAGIKKIITVGTTVSASRESINIVKKYSTDLLKIYATAGIHPVDSKDEVKNEESIAGAIEELKRLASSSDKVVAIGECGLDYYTDDSDSTSLKLGGTSQRPVTSDAEKEFQRKLFVEQVKLAIELNMPLVIHCRNGWDEIFDIISKFKAPQLCQGLSGQADSKLNGVFHSFTGGVEEAKRATELDFYVSFSGIVTFKNAKNVQEAAKIVPDNRLLIETDSPFLTPEPLRGQNNAPENVRIIASFLADLRSQTLDDVSNFTCQNAQKLFSLW